MLYLFYLVLLNAARGAIEEERLSIHIGLWAVHGAFFLLGLFLLIDKKQWFTSRRVATNNDKNIPALNEKVDTLEQDTP